MCAKFRYMHNISFASSLLKDEWLRELITDAIELLAVLCSWTFQVLNKETKDS